MINRSSKILRPSRSGRGRQQEKQTTDHSENGILTFEIDVEGQKFNRTKYTLDNQTIEMQEGQGFDPTSETSWTLGTPIDIA